MSDLDAATLPATVRELARTFADEGGRLYVVGGWVRDALRGRASKDLDLEVHAGIGVAEPFLLRIRHVQARRFRRR